MSHGISFEFNELAQLTQSAHFKPELPTVMYLHGFHEDQTKESVKEIHDAYISRGKENLILLDWAAVVAGNYIQAVIYEAAVSSYNILRRNRSCIKSESCVIVPF